MDKKVILKILKLETRIAREVFKLVRGQSKKGTLLKIFREAIRELEGTDL